MAGQTWGLPGPASLALTLRTAAVVVLFEERGRKRGQNGWRDFESSAIALGSKRGKKLSRGMLGCEQETGTRYSSRRRSVPCPGPGPGAVQVRSRPGGLPNWMEQTRAR